MKGKLAVALVGVLAIAVSRCGTDPCDAATSHLAACATSIPGASMASSSGTMVTFATGCDGASGCKAACVNEFSCMEINGNTPQFTDCLNSCNGK